MNGQCDILVIGDDEASLAAAAAAAKAGARVALLRPAERKKRPAATAPAIPNFVWRRLDLQDYDLTLEPVSARVTLFGEGAPLTTYANARATSDALAEQDVGDHLLWSDFLEEASALAGDDYLSSSYFNAAAPGGKALAVLLGDSGALARAARLFGPCADVLDDYFENDRLKAHVSAHALAKAGFGDREAGSATALAESFSEDAWRVRTPKDSVALREVLEKVCQDAGVEMLAGKVTEISAPSGKFIVVSIGADDKIRTRRIFFATPEAALAAGALNCAGLGGASLGRAGCATFTIRFKLSEPMDPPGGDAKALFQVIDAGADLQEARDAAVAGRLFDRLPVEFEFTPAGEIVARSSYLPAAFYEDGEWRGWTGQDRQAVATIVRERLASRMPGLAARIRRTEADVAAPSSAASPFAGCERVTVQPRRHDAVSAAVKLIDQVMAADE
jgi:phytoene dehydrogenase-like protein